MNHYSKTAALGTPFTDPSLGDKLFFTELPFFKDLSVLVEIGCGQHAHVMKAAGGLHLKLVLGGVDQKYACPILSGPGDWSDFLNVMKPGTKNNTGGDRALLFSSVIHEMFSLDGHYGKPDPAGFWTDILKTETEYVIVRDMSFACPADFVMPAERCHEGMTLHAMGLGMFRQLGLQERYAEVTKERMMSGLRGGDPHLCSKTVMREGLMQRMQLQWGERSAVTEAQEDYFALDAKQFDLAAQAAGYTPIHFKAYVPEGVLPTIREDLMSKGITTHLQAVYRKDDAETRPIH